MSVTLRTATSVAINHLNDQNYCHAHPRAQVRGKQIAMEMYVLINLLYYVVNLFDVALTNDALSVLSHRCLEIRKKRRGKDQKVDEDLCWVCLFL